MRKTLILRRILVLCSALLLLAALASAQSLGELARKQRELKAGQPKATKVYTNDNIPKTGGLSTSEQTKTEATDKETQTKEGEAAKPGDATKAGEAAKPGEAPESKPAKPTAAEEEKKWRARFAKLRADLATEERKLDLYQRELNLANIQFYSNPDQAMREQTMRTEVNNKTKDVEQQKAAVEAARKALSAAEEELQKKGLPPGWAR